MEDGEDLIACAACGVDVIVNLSELPPPQLGESRDLPGPPSFFDPQPIRDDGGSPSPAGAE